MRFLILALFASLLSAQSIGDDVSILLPDNLPTSEGYIETINATLGQNATGGEWDVYLSFYENENSEPIREYCPECMDVDPIPEVPEVDPNCDEVKEVELISSRLKLTSNAQYISDKLEYFESKGVLKDVSIRYALEYPAEDLDLLIDVFKDCEACGEVEIEVDPVPEVPEVPTVGDPC